MAKEPPIFLENLTLHFHRAGTVKNDITLDRMRQIESSLGWGWTLAGATQDFKIVEGE